MHRLIRRLTLAAPAIAIATMILTVSFAQAQQSRTAEGGHTNVKLAQSFVSALGSLGVAPGTVSPTELENGMVNFPITGGAIDLATGRGQILHSGGLTLTAGGTEVKLQSFIIDTTGPDLLITGLVVVNNSLIGRLPLFNLILPSGFTLPLKPNHGVLRVRGLGVSLTATAASALNGVFHITAVPANLPVGTASVTVMLDDKSDDHSDNSREN